MQRTIANPIISALLCIFFLLSDYSHYIAGKNGCVQVKINRLDVKDHIDKNTALVPKSIYKIQSGARQTQIEGALRHNFTIFQTNNKRQPDSFQKGVFEMYN